jgi:AbrB family looped-hinge helix DNA binding protein
MSEIIRIGKKAQMVIPRTIRKRLNLIEGRKVFVDTIGNVVIIIPVPESIEELSGIAKGLYDKDYIETLRDEWE